MRPSHSRFAATIIVGLFVAAACSSAAPPLPVLTPTPSLSEAGSTPAATAPLTPVFAPTPTPVAPPTANPTRSADATIRVVEVTAILDVAQADRFETFGAKAIRLEQVWSPNDTGLGGTCGVTNVPWLECLNLTDWLIQPVADGAGCPFTRTVLCYDGPRLDILYEPGLGERLGLGDGPVDLIGHFGDPASEGCRPENRAACRDRFVVTSIEQAGR
jgi:hypothetical protein